MSEYSLLCIDCGVELKNCAIINCKECKNEGHYCFRCNAHPKFTILPHIKMKSDVDATFKNLMAVFGNNNTKVYLAEYTVLMVTPIVELHDGTYRLIQWDEHEVSVRHENGNELEQYIIDGGFDLVYDGSEKDE